MVLVLSGKLLVISGYESKQVVIESFFIDRFEVTQKLYESIVGINLSFFRVEQRPVEKLNLFEAMEYCRRIKKRLPTEWEWADSYRETTGGKVLRGGSWRNSINAMRSSKWITSLPIHRFHYVGFRCAKSISSVVNN
jgi:formylglycine-generating enzyme required for sulfatase activity